MDLPNETWLERLPADPRAWLLDGADPAVRHASLLTLLDRPVDDPEVVTAQAAAMEADPIAATLAAMQPEGWWVKPGAGYAPKYTGTTWSLILLDQLMADPADPRVGRACAYVLDHVPTSSGGFGCSGVLDRVPPPSAVIHCLNGNLLRGLIGFGWLDDPRVQAAIDWEARAITGEDPPRFFASTTSGPGFACAANERLPCAWGAVKAVLGLARIPPEGRSPAVRRALDAGAAFLLSRNPAVADYPAGWGGRISSSWFKLGFPSGYVADVLQVLEALAELGMAGDERLRPALAWLVAKADRDGRWRNEYAYNRKTWVDVERQGRPSRWVTLRACRVLRAAAA